MGRVRRFLDRVFHRGPPRRGAWIPRGPHDEPALVPRRPRPKPSSGAAVLDLPGPSEDIDARGREAS